MFTGLVECIGRLGARVSRGAEHWLWLEARFPQREGEAAEKLHLGDSVAVNGACLTLVELGSGRFAVQTSEETLRRTNLAELNVGDAVNLERALRLSDRLGGHLVLGHVDGVGRIRSKRREGNATMLSIEAEAALLMQIVEKGSIAVDGVSLTVNSVDASGFSLAVIPYTSAKVALLERPPGWRVNLETDILGKYVQRLLGAGAAKPQASATADWELLRRAGFVSDDEGR